QAPLLGYPLQRGRSPRIEADPRSRDEVFDGARDEDLPRQRLLRNSGSYVHCDTADLAIHEFALAGMESSADFEFELPHAIRDRTGASDRACRSIEPCEKAVACDVELRTTEAEKLTADQRVVALEQLSPRSIADFRRPRRRTNDIGEKDGCKYAVWLCFLPAARLRDFFNESLDLCAYR